jgi:hypothetical protein
MFSTIVISQPILCQEKEFWVCTDVTRREDMHCMITDDVTFILITANIIFILCIICTKVSEVIHQITNIIKVLHSATGNWTFESGNTAAENHFSTTE